MKKSLSNYIENIIIAVLIVIITMIVFLICFKNYNKSQTETGNNETINENVDTDNDKLIDDDEINIYKTDPLKADTDEDGIIDSDELSIKTDPLKDDTDGDGLLDGKPIIIKNLKIAPVDPNPLIKNGKDGIWQKNNKIYSSTSVPSHLTTSYKYNSQNGISELNGLKMNDISTFLISDILFFRTDTTGVILHSQTKKETYEYVMENARKNLSSFEYKKLCEFVKKYQLQYVIDTWQKKYGYNQLYDDIFRKSVNGNMKSLQLYCRDSLNNDYVIWLWKGDYLKLGTGAEIGIYVKSQSNSSHWDSVNFELPMNLNLYNYEANNSIEPIFNWNPINRQWWITGFNPNKTGKKVNNLVLLGNINFTSRPELYESLKNNYQDNELLIFDDSDKTVWINW